MRANNLRNWSLPSVLEDIRQQLAELLTPRMLLILGFGLLLILSGCGTTASVSAQPRASVPGDLMQAPLGPVWLSPRTLPQTSDKTPNAGPSVDPKSGAGKPGPASMATPQRVSVMECSRMLRMLAALKCLGAGRDILVPRRFDPGPELLAVTDAKPEKQLARMAHALPPQARTYQSPMVSGLEIRSRFPRRA